MDGKTALDLLEQFDREREQSDAHQEVLVDYLEDVDGALINRGWAMKGAKTVQYGYHDQSLLQHVRNGVFFLFRLNEVAADLGVRTLTSDELRNVISLFVAHDLHKTRDTSGPEEEFDIPRDGVESFVTDIGLLEFAEGITVDDCWSCACAHHDSWNAKTGNVTIAFDELRGYVRLADAFASSPTPEDAVNQKTRDRFHDVFFGDLDLRYHRLSDVKGVLTNLTNTAVSTYLEQYDYHVLTIYQDGCVYAVPCDTPSRTVDREVIDSMYRTFTEIVRTSHPSYMNPTKLMDSIDAGRLGYYVLSDQDFFYAGPERVLEAVVRKAAQDGDTEDDPTEAMSAGIATVDEEIPIELDETRQLVAAARLVYSVHRSITPALGAEDDDFDVTCDIFAVDEDVRQALHETKDRDPGLLKSGGKWEYSYAIAQDLLDREFNGVPAKDLSPVRFGDEVSDFLLERLSRYDGWEDIDEAFTTDIRSELTAYFADILILDGTAANVDAGLSDPFDEYTGKRGGKICTLCNRGTMGNKGDMETKKSLSTLQAGFSNRVQIGAGKPEKLLMCEPCRIEFSLRTVGGTRREAGRLYFHFVPDYFYTPTTWELTRLLFSRFRGDAGVRIGRLAEAFFEEAANEATYQKVIGDLSFDVDEGGMRMVESLKQGFQQGFGSVPMGYFKPHENETEFQFFGVYVALSIAAYTGLRVLVSENPVPELGARDFKSMAHLGAGLTPVHRFYGEQVTLDELEPTLKAASALIQLGYANERKDSLFPKFLRATRNKHLPGSYLLKRVAQEDPDEGSRIAWNLMDEAKYLDTTTGVTIDNDT